MSKPKPFGWLTIIEGKPKITWEKLVKHLPEDSPIPVYIHPPFHTSPPKREWVGLTDEERQEILKREVHWTGVAQAIEAKLKEKNA
jgi:hypothetical protein